MSRTICRISYIRIFFLPSQTFLVGKQNVQGLTKTWAWPGFEPGTSRTRSANHTPRPSSHLYYIQCHTKSYKSHNFIVRLKMRTGKIFNLLILKKGLFMHKISWLSHLSSSCGRVVKALDLKSNGLCPRRFEPCQLRKPFDTTKMPPMGIEPMTPGLRDQCSTTELKRLLQAVPSDYKQTSYWIEGQRGRVV